MLGFFVGAAPIDMSCVGGVDCFLLDASDKLMKDHVCHLVLVKEGRAIWREKVFKVKADAIGMG